MSNTLCELRDISVKAHHVCDQALNWAEYLADECTIDKRDFRHLQEYLERLELMVRIVDIGLLRHALREPHPNKMKG